MNPADDEDWLGEDTIQQNGNRITVPPEVIDAGIVDRGAPVFWAVDAEGVVFSKHRVPFEETDQFRLLGESSLDENRKTPFPAEVTDREGFAAGAILHFVRAETDATTPVGRILTEDTAEHGHR